MLVLSRKKDESIIIGGGHTLYVFEDGHYKPVGPIEVMVADFVGGDKVRLGVIANRSVTVHRNEVQDDVDRNGPQRRVG